MAQALQWLNQASFEGRIKLPANFDYSVFEQFILNIEERELRVMLGEKRLTALRTWLEYNPAGVALVLDSSASPAPAFDASMPGLYKLVVPFLVYAAYAEYLFQGDVQPTDTGAVIKNRDSSEGLSDVRIMQLYRSYRGMAEARISDITDFLKTEETACELTSAYGPRFSSSRGRTQSIINY